MEQQIGPESATELQDRCSAQRQNNVSKWKSKNTERPLFWRAAIKKKGNRLWSKARKPVLHALAEFFKRKLGFSSNLPLSSSAPQVTASRRSATQIQHGHQVGNLSTEILKGPSAKLSTYIEATSATLRGIDNDVSNMICTPRRLTKVSVVRAMRLAWILHLLPISRVAESEFFGWSRSPNNTGSRIFLSDSKCPIRPFFTLHS